MVWRDNRCCSCSTITLPAAPLNGDPRFDQLTRFPAGRGFWQIAPLDDELDELEELDDELDEEEDDDDELEDDDELDDELLLDEELDELAF